MLCQVVSLGDNPPQHNRRDHPLGKGDVWEHQDATWRHLLVGIEGNLGVPAMRAGGYYTFLFGIVRESTLEIPWISKKLPRDHRTKLI